MVFPVLLEVGTLASLNRKELMFGYAAVTAGVLLLLCVGWFKVAYLADFGKDEPSSLHEDMMSSGSRCNYSHCPLSYFLL